MKCKHCGSEKTIEVLIIRSPMYHIDSMDFVGDVGEPKTFLCEVCGRISFHKKKERR